MKMYDPYALPVRCNRILPRFSSLLLPLCVVVVVFVPFCLSISLSLSLFHYHNPHVSRCVFFLLLGAFSFTFACNIYIYIGLGFRVLGDILMLSSCACILGFRVLRVKIMIFYVWSLSYIK